AVYLLSHGIAKVVLVALVLRDKLWAYPWLIALLLAFIAYQLYRITVVHFSIGLTLLSIFDAFLVWLTWREYRSKRARQPQARAPAAQQQAGQGHGLPDQAESAEHAAANAVRDMRLGDGGEGGVADGGADSVAHPHGQRRGQRADAGEHES